MSYLWVNSKTSHVNKCKGDKKVHEIILWHNTRKTGSTPPSMFEFRTRNKPKVFSLKRLLNLK